LEQNMPDTDDKEMEDLASSAGPEDVTPETAITASSSDAEQSEGESDLLAVVRDVVTKGKETPEPPASQADGEEDGKTDADAEAKDQDDENFSDVPFNKHPRFKQLLSERNAFKADAQNYRNVQNFIDAQGLTAEETADGLIIMGLAKTNPAEAWKQIKPWVQSLMVASGEVLPDDLKSMVQKGEVSVQAALEVSRSRAAVQSVQAQREADRQRAERDRQQGAVVALRTAAESWQAERRQKDPNFDAKMQPLMEKVAYLQATEGKPTTPEGVREQLQKAYKALAAVVAPAAPAAAPKPAITPIRGGAVAGNQAPVAQSTLDIIKARVGNRS
jgi:hypothetical protein